MSGHDARKAAIDILGDLEAWTAENKEPTRNQLKWLLMRIGFVRDLLHEATEDQPPPHSWTRIDLVDVGNKAALHEYYSIFLSEQGWECVADSDASGLWVRDGFTSPLADEEAVAETLEWHRTEKYSAEVLHDTLACVLSEYRSLRRAIIALVNGLNKGLHDDAMVGLNRVADKCRELDGL